MRLSIDNEVLPAETNEAEHVEVYVLMEKLLKCREEVFHKAEVNINNAQKKTERDI